MAAIASVFIECLPETSKVADGIRRAFREADPIAAEAGRRWGTEIERGIGTVKVEVDADTAKARAQIDAMARDRKATVEVDADTAGASIQRAVSSGISQGGSVGISALNPALLGIGITIAGGVASALSGLAGLLPAALLGAGGVVGTLTTGLSGVKEAWDDAGKAADASGSDQASKAKEVTSAQRGLRDAVQSEEQAQKDVASARRDALTQLRDLNLEMRGGALDERQAILDAQAARRDLTTGRFKDSIEYQQAQLRVEEADQRVAEAQQRNTDLQTKATDAQAKGVDGADNVVRANENLARTQEQVAVAQQNLTDASNKTSSAQATAAQSWAALAPNAQAFLTVLQNLKPMWDGLQDSVQNTLFAGVGEQLQALATQYMPLLQGAMTGMAGTMNQTFGQLADFFAKPETMAMMQQIFANIGQSFQIWAQSMIPFTQAFLTVSQAGSGFLPQLASMVVNVANAFNQWAQSGQLTTWIGTGITALQQLGTVVQMLIPAFGALAPIGNAFLGMLIQVLPPILASVMQLAPAFANWIVAITPLLTILGQLVVALMPAFIGLMNNSTDTLNRTTGPLQTVVGWLGQLSSSIGTLIGNDQGVRTFFEAIRQGVLDVLNPLKILVDTVEAIRGLFTGEGTAKDNAQKLLDAARNGTPPPPGVLASQVPSEGWGGGGGSFATPGLAPPALPSTTAPGSPGVWTPGPGQAPRRWVPGQGWVEIPNFSAPVIPKPSASGIVTSSPAVPSSAVMPSAGYTSDAALLAAVPAGRYTQTQGADLTKGLADCSSAVEDLVNIMDGRPTAGRAMATGNEADWLTSHGFVKGMGGPGDFRVGFNSGHTQATLPGGTPFNWGSDSAAAKRGIGGTGADDPAFTSHYYRPVAGSMPAMPAAATPGMPGSVSGVTPPLGTPTDPYYMQYPDGYKPPGPDIGQFGQQMGSDIWSSILPEGFKNPTQFGSMKFLTGFLGGILGGNFGGSGSGSGKGMPASYWANGGTDMAGGGGGGGLLSGLFSGISGFTPQAFTPQSGSPGSAPGQFMPLMPTPADAAVSPFGMTGQGGAAGPGNQVVNAPININNPVGQDHLTNMVNTATQAQVPRVRQGIRPLP